MNKLKDAEFTYFTLCSLADLLDLEGFSAVADEFAALFPDHAKEFSTHLVGGVNNPFKGVLLTAKE